MDETPKDSDLTSKVLSDIRGDIREVRGDLDSFKLEVDNRLRAIDRRFSAVDRRFDGIDARFDETHRYIRESELRITTAIHELVDMNRTVLTGLAGRVTRTEHDIAELKQRP